MKINKYEYWPKNISKKETVIKDLIFIIEVGFISKEMNLITNF